MKSNRKRNFCLGALLVILLALCVGFVTATVITTKEHTVSFYDETGTLIGWTSVPYGETVETLPYEGGVWQDEDGVIVEPTEIAVTGDMSFYAAPGHTWSTLALRTEHGRLMAADTSRFFTDAAVTRGEAAELIYALVDAGADVGASFGSFSDMTGSEACYEAVRALCAMGVLHGYADGTFRPEEEMTRAEFLYILYRLRGEEYEGSASFPDVPESYWASDAIAYAEETGWAVGYADGNFYPDAALTRAEAAVMIARVRGGLPDRADVDAACADTIVYVDVPASHWAYYEIIDAAYTNELLDYILGQAEGVQPGIVFIGAQMCHVNADTLRLDRYEQGIQSVDGALYYVTTDGFFLQRFSQGLLELDGSMFYVTEDDGPFLADDYYGYLYFGEDGRYTSGSAAVDAYVDDILSDILYNIGLSQSEKLYRAYCAIRDGGYYYRPRNAAWQRGSTSWTLTCAEAMYRDKYGTCYYWAASFLYLARRLGYQAYAVCGGVGTSNQLHAWVVVTWDDGEDYICDVELEWAYIHDFYDVPYSTTNMYLQPLDATNVIYVFPGQSAAYYESQGIAEESDEDLLNIAEEDQVPQTTEPADETNADEGETPAEDGGADDGGADDGAADSSGADDGGTDSGAADDEMPEADDGGTDTGGGDGTEDEAA